MSDELALKTKLTELHKENKSLTKENIDLRFLINSQDRLIKKLQKQNEEYVLLLDETLRRNNER